MTEQIWPDLVAQRMRDLGPQDCAVGQGLAVTPVVPDAPSTATGARNLFPATVAFEIRLQIPKRRQGDGSAGCGGLGEERLSQLAVVE